MPRLAFDSRFDFVQRRLGLLDCVVYRRQTGVSFDLALSELARSRSAMNWPGAENFARWPKTALHVHTRLSYIVATIVKFHGASAAGRQTDLAALASKLHYGGPVRRLVRSPPGARKV